MLGDDDVGQANNALAVNLVDLQAATPNELTV